MRCGYCRGFDGTASQVLAHQRGGCSTDPRWGRVVRLRQDGENDKATRVAKRLVGAKKKKGPPMTEEKKEYLKNLREERSRLGAAKVV